MPFKEEMDMSVVQSRTRAGGVRAKFLKPLAAVSLAVAMVASMSSLSASADEEIDLTPGPTIIADPNSPTGYTGHFVYCNPTATSVRFVADILLRSWVDPTNATVYQPQQYAPGLMRGAGAYDVQMTKVGDCWVHDVPLAAGVNQYWFYVNNNTQTWINDPANHPIYAPDGLTGNARRAFNAVYVPYDPVKQNYAPLEERVINNPRPDSAKGTWSYVPFATINGVQRTLGVYLPPGYDAEREEPYKTIYVQHGSGQDQSDWLNIGSVPIIMDNLLQDGTTEPAVIISTNSNYLGAANQGYPNITNLIIPFVEANYNVSTDRLDRAWAGLSMGASITTGIINNNAARFGYYGVWSFNAGISRTAPNLDQAYIHIGCGVWDNLNLCATPTALNNLNGYANYKNTRIAGGHDFNAWPQLFAMWARDYLWTPSAFNQAPVFTAGGESQTVAEGQNLTFAVEAIDPDGARDVLTYTTSTLPAGATFDPATRTFSWTPGFNQAGSFAVTFTASDGTRAFSLSGTKTVTITIGEVPQVSATASVRCVAGKALVAVTVANTDPASSNLVLTSAYGTKSFTGIASGKSATHSFTTRLGSVLAGTVTVDATVNGATTQVTAAYPATVCS
jgi:hypothetical protein